MTKDTLLCIKQKAGDNLVPFLAFLLLRSRLPAKRYIQMLWIIFIGSLALWLLFVIPSWTFGAFVQVLLLFAVAALVFQVLTHRDTPA